MKNFTCLFFLSLALGLKLSAQTVHLTPFNTSNIGWLLGFERAPGTDKLFALRKDGYIELLNADGSYYGTFLNLHTKVNHQVSNEQGLVGLAFHPDYASNGYCYVFYNKTGTGDCTISRFKRSASNPNYVDPSSELVLLTYPHPNASHVGGCMKFGPDGYLYIGTGDGGGTGDPNGNGQNKMTFLGKILRIDVNVPDGTTPAYAIPPGNPFNGALSILNEIWAYGLRNPWHFTFDRLTGDLWIGDVGQDQREEVNFVPAGTPGGLNFGWSCKEGTLDFNAAQCSPTGTYTPPIYEYPHEATGTWCEGSVSGGVVYRGGEWADLYGKYIFTDFCTGKIWALSQTGGAAEVTELGNFTDIDFTMVDENNAGELLLAGFNSNKIWWLKSDDCTPVVQITGADTLYLPSGGSLVLNGAPGLGNLTYQWLQNGNPVFGGNAATLTVTASGVYSVVVTNPVENCFAQSTEVVVLPAGGSLVISGETQVCEGQPSAYSVPAVTGASYVWTFTGASNVQGMGTNSIQLTWSDAVNAGQMSLQMTLPGGEIFTGTLDVVVHDNDLVPDASISNVDCFGGANGSIDIEVSTVADSVWFQWSNGSTSEDLQNLAANFYSVTISNSWACTDELLLTLVAPDSLTVQVQSSPPSQGLADGSISLIVSGGTPGDFPPYWVQWSNGAGGFQNDSIPAGTYTAIVTDANGCADTVEVVLEEALATAAGWQDWGVSVFPNPAGGDFTVEFSLPEAMEVSMELLDPLGRQAAVLSKNERLAAGGHSLKYSCEQLPAGMYWLCLRTERGDWLVRKLSKLY